MRWKRWLVEIMCMALLIGTVAIAPSNAKACGHIHTTKQGGRVYVVACDGTDSVYVLKNSTYFYVYVKGNKCSFINKSGNVKSVSWQGYKTVNGVKGGAYKVTIKKTKPPKYIGSATFGSGKKRVKLNFASAGTLDF